MKKILVATDFSDTSKNAIDYSVELAKTINGAIILLHVYHVPSIATENLSFIPSLDDIEKDALSFLNSKAALIKEKYPAISVESKCECGFAVEEIMTIAEEYKVDLIVMGMQGAGVFYEKLIGSTTTALIRKVKMPVLVVGKENRYKPIKKIVLATDYHKLENKNVLNPLKEFCKIFNAHLFCLNVTTQEIEVPTLDEAVQSIKINKDLEGLKHNFYTVKNNDVVDGVNSFVQEHDADWIVMIPRDHNFIWNIFNEPTSKKMAFHSTIPLLTLHE